MTKKRNWSLFYAKTKDAPPSPLLVRALQNKHLLGKALDLGGGALKDTRYLLEKGFEVLDLDREALPDALRADLDPVRFQYRQSAFADFHFPHDEYAIVSAMYALPFNPPETFTDVMERIKRSLCKDGIFCGNFFGIHDEWSSTTDMTFLTTQRVKALFVGMEMLSFEEREWDGILVDGRPKHWHTVDVIAKRTE